MKLGVFAAVFGTLPFAEMLAEVARLGHVTAVELGTGAWPGSPHVDVDRLLRCPDDARVFRQRIADAGLSISALSCHGNPLHPDSVRAGADDETFRKTVCLASRLEVPVVVTFSGCPGDSADARHPNWVTTPWPPEYLDVLEWQWEERAIPYWYAAAAFARDHHVKVALEPHPGFLVYNVDTALRLRAAAGPNLGVNFDPSHFFWQGMDPVVTIRAMGDAIFHVHAKDVALNRREVAVNGVLDARSYRRLSQRGARTGALGQLGGGGIPRVARTPALDGDTQPELRASRSRGHQRAPAIRDRGAEPHHPGAARERGTAGLQRVAAVVRAAIARRAHALSELHARQGHERCHAARWRWRATGLRRRSQSDSRARMESERYRHPSSLCPLPQLRAAVWPRRNERAPAPHRRLAGEHAGVLAERSAVHRV